MQMIGRKSGLIALAFAAAVTGLAAVPAAQQPAASKSGWDLPPEAQTLKNPLTVDAKVLASGKATFKEKCQKCHGPQGKGDGPDADPDTRKTWTSPPRSGPQEPGRRCLLQGLERPEETEDAGGEGRPDERAALGGRRLRPDTAQDRTLAATACA